MSTGARLLPLRCLPSLRPSPPAPALPRSPCPLPGSTVRPAPRSRDPAPRAAPRRSRPPSEDAALSLAPFVFVPFHRRARSRGCPRPFVDAKSDFFFFFLFSSGFGGVWLRFRLSVADRQIDVSSTLITARSWRLRAPARGVRLKAEPRENGAR